MILFDLRCGSGHAFEGWFKDGKTFEAQVAAREVTCPLCGDQQVSKAIMAPAVAPSKNRPDPVQSREQAAKFMKMAREVQTFVEKNFDHVGNRFAEEARKIHYGEVEKRNIYGDATKEESKSLKDEGIEVGQIPWLPRHDG